MFWPRLFQLRFLYPTGRRFLLIWDLHTRWQGQSWRWAGTSPVQHDQILFLLSNRYLRLAVFVGFRPKFGWIIAALVNFEVKIVRFVWSMLAALLNEITG